MKKNSCIKESLPLIIGEALISLLVVGVFALLDLVFEGEFWNLDLGVVLGVLLGSVVTVLNYAFLMLSVNNAVNKFLAVRGTREMTDEEAEKFAAENSMGIQNAIKASFIIRTLSMLVTLVIAFLLGDLFNPVATVIPLISYRPILYVSELISSKRAAKALGAAAALAGSSATSFGEGAPDITTSAVDSEDTEREPDTVREADEAVTLNEKESDN